MMERLSLEFQGPQSQGLLLAILAAVAVILAAAGVWRLIARKGWYAAMCLSVAGGLLPALLLQPAYGWVREAALFAPIPLMAVLILHGVRGLSEGDRKARRASWVCAGILGALVALGATTALAKGETGRSAVAMWLTGVTVGMAIGVFYGAVFQHLGLGRVTLLMVLRSLSILALLLVLFRPVVSKAPEIGEFTKYLPVLVDRSGSMSLPPRGVEGVDSRYKQAVQMLAFESNRMRKHFRPKWYCFARNVTPEEGPGSMAKRSPTGEGTDATDLVTAIEEVSGEYGRSTTTIPGLLVLTDGNDTVSKEPALYQAAFDARVPVFTVGVGEKDDEAAGAKNIEIVEVQVDPEAIRHNVTKVRARVKISGFAGNPTQLRLMEDGSDVPVATERLMTSQNSEILDVNMKWTPKSLSADGGETDVAAGVRKLTVIVDAKPGEMVTADNRTEVHVLVTEPRLRVLYIEGKMRLEYKFLKQILDTDPNVQFVSLIRVSENRFWSYGQINGKKLTNLPTSDQDFQMLDVIILGDLDRAFLEPSGALGKGRMTKIMEWVKNGGGLLMIGGSKSFGPGGYTNTDIEKALPVLVGGRGIGQEMSEFVPQLTALGERHPIFEGITGFFPGPAGRKPDPKLPKLPPLQGCVKIERAKDTAALLAVHPTARGPHGLLPILAVQPFGAGRTAAFAADTTYKWYFSLRGKGVRTPYERFWGQMIRWLAKVDTKSKKAKPSVLLRMDHSYIQVGQTVQLTAHVKDEKGQAVPDSQVTATIKRADGQGDPIVMPLAPQTGGKQFQDNFRPPKDGEYVIRVAATDNTGRELGADELTLTVAPHSAEMTHVGLKKGVLREIARRSGGAYTDITGLPEMIDTILESQKRSEDESNQPKPYPLYHFLTLFLLFVALITGEWLLRRSWQLH